MDISQYRKMTKKRAASETVGILAALFLSFLNYYLPVDTEITGVILAAGILGVIPGIITVFLILVMGFVMGGGIFEVNFACGYQLIVIVTVFFVRKGFLRSVRRSALMVSVISVISVALSVLGYEIEELSNGILDLKIHFKLSFLGSVPMIILSVFCLFLYMNRMPDRILMYLPNAGEYIKDEELKCCVDSRTIQSRRRSVGAKIAIVIISVATVMTVTAIFLFNVLYFSPQMMRINMDRNRPEFGMPPNAGEAPKAPDEIRDTANPEAFDGDFDADTEITVEGNKILASDLIDKLGGGAQLGQWDNRKGIAKNIAFFIKFVMGLFYVEIALIAAAIGYVRRKMVEPVEAIAYSMDLYAVGSEEDRIRCGENIHKLGISTGDELEGLYHSFEKMVDDFGDYIERLKKENEIRRDLEVEKQANVAKSAFLSNMSHELRTPINAVLGMDEMILRESEDDEIRKYASDIQNAGKSLLGLVNDILDFSKIEAGKLEIIPVDYELSSVINDLINLIRIKAADKKLKLNVHVDETTPHLLHGDEIRIKQVITNILTNAVKYTEKGSITLDFGYEWSGDEEIDLFVSVKDTGIGIREEDLNKLFVAFERIEEKRNRTIEGTGLGMNITQNLLNMMGSTLEVKSVYGEGSEFSFKLRQGIRSKDPIGNMEETYARSLEDRTVYRESFRAPDAVILVVDDTEMNLEVIKGLLKQTCIGIDTATSGAECLKKVREKRYDIIFLDHRMPEMDGMETFEKLREMDESVSKCVDVPVIALTANAVSGAREEYLRAGFNDYLTKPVDSARLEKLIIRYLPDEKITLTRETEPETKDEEPLPEWLNDSDMLDLEAGVLNCGSNRDYMTAIRLFYNNIPDNKEDIRGFFDNKDWKNYNIKVHALKSSARLIGAKALSAAAEKLEAASNEGNVDEGYILENTGELLIMYRNLRDALSPLDRSEVKEETEEKKEIDSDGISDAYNSLLELIGVADFESCNMIISSLDGYAVPDGTEKACFEGIRKAAEKFDWDTVERLIKERAYNS